MYEINFVDTHHDYLNAMDRINEILSFEKTPEIEEELAHLAELVNDYEEKVIKFSDKE